MANPANYSDGQGRPWQPNSTFEVGQRFNVTSINYWRESLSPQEIGVIEFLCAEEMNTLGYRRACPGFGEQEFLEFREDEHQITEWLKQAPYLLDSTQREAELIRYRDARGL